MGKYLHFRYLKCLVIVWGTWLMFLFCNVFMMIQWMRWGESDDVFDVVMFLYIDICNFYV